MFLKGYSDPYILVDRVSRGSERVDRPALTMALTVQPDVLREVGANPVFRQRGLLARFLFSVPVSMVGERDVDLHPIDQGASDAWTEGVTTLLSIPEDPHANDRGKWRLLQLDTDAQAQHRAFRAWLEPQLAPFKRLEDIGDWAGKIAGNVARVAGLLHMMRHVSHPAPWEAPVTGATMASAIKIGHYLIGHAHAAFGSMVRTDADNPEIQRAIDWLKQDQRDIIPHQEMWQGIRRKGYTVKEHFQPILEKLVERRLIKVVTVKSGGRGRPKRNIETNPLWIR